MTADDTRAVTLRRTGSGRFVATNPAGVELPLGTTEGVFTPIELLLAGIAGCTALDVEALTSRRAEADEFTVDSSGRKVRDEDGNHLTDVEVVFRVRFPEGAEGDAAREVLPQMVARSHDRLCTVSRTVERETPVTTRIE